MANDLLDSLLDLEEGFYKEGYDLGVADGSLAGYTEGSVFAVEKGFEKFLEMGRLYGKALVWTQRLSSSPKTELHDQNAEEGEKAGISKPDASKESEDTEEISISPDICQGMSNLPESSRLAKNIRSLLDQVDPAELSMENTEEAVSNVDQRLKTATMKAKLVQRALGEREDTLDINPQGIEASRLTGDGTGSIEDISSLVIRH